ncbi:glycosyltransferase [Clostridium tunisiense]|uniref:glycosyltransferase n=1 Tax=Clostridium tunisiense TaxID=219748 RepID=UPI0003031F86|nr:glycosyltransferase [Clostridium tunisiense]
MSKGTIIYIGGFALPDKNAAAHRVINNAKILRELGYNVVFISKIVDKLATSNNKKMVKYYGFECWEIELKQSKVEMVKALFEISSIKPILEKYSDLKIVIAYNFPAIALLKLRNYCSDNGIKCLGDITEWYGTKDKSLIYKLIKGFDSTLRMRVINKMLDGLIVISNYLLNYYENKKNIICIPPLVDLSDEKWIFKEEFKENKMTFVYAGAPSSEKERLDIIVKCINELSYYYPVVLNIIGITEEQFYSIYKIHSHFNFHSDAIIFHGRLNHRKTIESVKLADFSLVIREDSRLTKAGFPTKFVESITCGTPVIFTDNSDLKRYVQNGMNGYIVTIDNFKEDLEKIIKANAEIRVDNNIFDYKSYIEDTQQFMEMIFNK